MSWFSTHVIAPLEDFFKTVEPIVVNDLEAFAEAFAQIALGAVLEQAPLVIAGSEKFGAAVTKVIQEAEAKGWQVAQPAAAQLVQQVYVAAAVAMNKQTLVVPPGSTATLNAPDLTVPAAATSAQ